MVMNIEETTLRKVKSEEKNEKSYRIDKQCSVNFSLQSKTKLRSTLYGTLYKCATIKACTYK